MLLLEQVNREVVQAVNDKLLNNLAEPPLICLGFYVAIFGASTRLNPSSTALFFKLFTTRSRYCLS